MSKADLYTFQGNKKGNIDLPKSLLTEVNLPLLAQAMRVYQDRQHAGNSKVKTRGEVEGSTRKIYRQKGTGMARHGARRAPIFVGGGIVHGPIGVKRTLHLPQKMRRKALKAAISLKAQGGQVAVVESMKDAKKTKDINTLVSAVIQEKGLAQKTSVLLVLSDENKNSALLGRNLANIKTKSIRILTAYDVLISGLVLVEKDALGITEAKKSKVKTKSEAKRKDKAKLGRQ